MGRARDGLSTASQQGDGGEPKQGLPQVATSLPHAPGPLARQNGRMKYLALGTFAVVGVLAGCGTKEQASPQAGPQPAPPSVAPATTTTTTMPAPPPVWRTARWGMTKDEVLAAFPGEAQRLSKPADFGPATPGSTDVAIPAYEADGMTFRVLFGFESSVLNRIHLSAAKPGDATCSDLDKLLTEKHAAPGARNDTGTSLRGEEIVWRRPDQTITLACAGVVSLGFRSVTLIYTPPS